VCHNYTHHKPHYFPEYVHCNKQPNNGTGKPFIDKKITGQSIRKVIIITTASDDIPMGFNNSKKKGVSRKSHLKEKLVQEASLILLTIVLVKV
jgi:hypothetical protein